jgi:alkylated DNA repair dioxygenase AlkB
MPRPRSGGREAPRYDLGHGGLLVMGGSYQRTWEHARLKSYGEVMAPFRRA